MALSKSPLKYADSALAKDVLQSTSCASVVSGVIRRIQADRTQAKKVLDSLSGAIIHIELSLVIIGMWEA